MTGADADVSADSAVGQAAAREGVLLGLVAELQRGVEQSGVPAASGAVFGLDLVLSVARGLEAARQEQGVRIFQTSDFNLLTVADVVTVAAARAVKALEQAGSVQQREHVPALVDLWIRAEGVRSLWGEVYCGAAGAGGAAEGSEVVRASVRQLAAEALAVAARISELAPLFAEFVVRLPAAAS